MKTHRNTKAAWRRSGTCLPLFTILSLAIAAPALAADTTLPKDHALFVGVTLRIEHGKDFLELVGAKGDTVSLLANGKVQEMKRDAVDNLRIEMGLKLSDVVAQVDKLEVNPTYVPSNADRWDSMRQQSLLADMSARQTDSMSAAAAHMADVDGQAVALLASPTSPYAPPPNPEARNGLIASASNDFLAAGKTSISVNSSASSMAPGGSTRNALEINCSLSSPKLTHNAYALVITEFQATADSKVSYRVHIEPVGDLGPKARTFTMTQKGLPGDFILGRVGVHLYSDGQELATNLSEQRVDLTVDDAMRYLVLSYVASHSKDSLAASPLRIALPADFKQKASAADLAQTIYVTVGADGAVHALSAAPDHAISVNPYVDSAVRKFRYQPALKEGKPVESVVELRLASLL